MAEYPKLSGAKSLGPWFWAKYNAMAGSRGWDRSAIAAVMHVESGFQPDAGSSAWSPSRTASGLLQFIESTANRLGVEPTSIRPKGVSHSGSGKAWSTWTILNMPAEDQLDLVRQYYEGAGANSNWRPVDYYLATWGAKSGLSLSTVLADLEGDNANLYKANPGLDRNQDGRITVEDLDGFVKSHYPTQWIDEPIPIDSSPPGEPAPSSGGGKLLLVVLIGVLSTILTFVAAKSRKV
jgi:hypothetical protein